jgi:hypothetical protein
MGWRALLLGPVDPGDYHPMLAGYFRSGRGNWTIRLHGLLPSSWLPPAVKANCLNRYVGRLYRLNCGYIRSLNLKRTFAYRPVTRVSDRIYKVGHVPILTA